MHTEKELSAAPDVAFCSSCGAQNRSGAQFCRKCGANLDSASAPAVLVGTVGAPHQFQQPQGASVMAPMLKALLITGALLACAIGVVLITADPSIGRAAILLLWIGSSIWVVSDSMKIRKIKKGVPHPMLLLLGLLLLWIVYFPNYLYRRFKAFSPRVSLT
jgi:hypothetical protein